MNARGVVWGSNLCLLQVAAVSGVRSLLEEEQSARILHQRRKTVQPSCLGACPAIRSHFVASRCGTLHWDALRTAMIAER